MLCSTYIIVSFSDSDSINIRSSSSFLYDILATVFWSEGLFLESNRPVLRGSIDGFTFNELFFGSLPTLFKE
jgi:hypothetical protein